MMTGNSSGALPWHPDLSSVMPTSFRDEEVKEDTGGGNDLFRSRAGMEHIYLNAQAREVVLSGGVWQLLVSLLGSRQAHPLL